MHHMLREPHRLSAVYVWPHVHVLRVRHPAVAWKGGWALSPLSSHYQRRHSHLQVVIGYVCWTLHWFLLTRVHFTAEEFGGNIQRKGEIFFYATSKIKF